MLRTLLLVTLLFTGYAQAAAKSAAIEYMSRAQLTTALVLARTKQVPAIRNTGMFPDIKKGAWYEQYMLYGQQIGIIQPEEHTNNLRPDTSVSRAEFLRMLTNAYLFPTGYPSHFRDVPADAWFAGYAGLAEQFKLFTLNDHTLLEPQRAVTKLEAMQAISTMQKIWEGKDPVTLEEQSIAKDQSEGKLQLYTVISTRRENITLVEPPPEAKPVPMLSTPTLNDQRVQLLKLVNTIRRVNGLSQLTMDNRLNLSAQTYADQMAAQNFFAHVSPEGQTLKDRMALSGFYSEMTRPDCNCSPAFALGENLARGQTSPEKAISAWLKSPSHRAAMLNPSYTHTGFGIKAGYWVEHFGGLLPEPTLK